MTLTGRTRFRSERRWGKEILILQVEEKVPGSICRYTFDVGPGGLRWRDAKVTDLDVELQP